MNKISKSVLLILASFAVMQSISGCMQSNIQETTRAPSPFHKVEEIRDIELIWSLDNVYTVWNPFDTTIDAIRDQVCFLGGLNANIQKNIVCLDGHDGRLLWQGESGIHIAIEVTPSGVFVAYGSPALVKKYDLPTGDILWSREVKGSGCYYSYFVDNQLQIFCNPTGHWILDEYGNLVGNTNKHSYTFISIPDETFVRLNGLISKNTETGQINWEFRDMDDLFYFMPTFTKDKVFVRTGQTMGSAYALKRKTGIQLWKTENVISNIVHSPEKQRIYVLQRDGKLIAIDENSGQEILIAKFAPAPFVLVGEGDADGYQLAYDSDEQILFALLGDSRQLFAFDER